MYIYTYIYIMCIYIYTYIHTYIYTSPTMVSGHASRPTNAAPGDSDARGLASRATERRACELYVGDKSVCLMTVTVVTSIPIICTYDVRHKVGAHSEGHSKLQVETIENVVLLAVLPSASTSLGRVAESAALFSNGAKQRVLIHKGPPRANR